MSKKNSFNYDELIDCANGKLFGTGNAKLPSPPMLMFHRITNVSEKKGKFDKGLIEAELDIQEKMWFFNCHFKDDPVMPGCLGLDAMWQLVGFYLGWKGEPGKGRALGVNSVKFTGEVLITAKIAKYEVHIKRILKKEGAVVGLADGILYADNKAIYKADNLKVGLFKK
jgi:3-hydroxyacyl-[acyl-carrier protein] dehydratase/trans-2-decenoyl-[acyl-carrier protein] isomerase